MKAWFSPRRAVVLAALGVALAGGAYRLDAQERRWIFQPAPAAAGQTANPGDMSDVWIRYRSAEAGADVTLHALWDANEKPDAPVLLYLHGARRDVDASVYRIRDMRALGFSVLAIDYRGFGRSTDELPSQASAEEDARAAWDWVARNHPGRDRYIFGHSLGGAIAVDLASRVSDAKGLMVEGTFPSIADVFRSFRFGWLPITWLITQPFDAGLSIAKVKVPVLVVHGASDALIPPSLGRALYERATAPKRFVLVEGGNHYSTNMLGQPQYKQALHDLFGWPK